MTLSNSDDDSHAVKTPSLSKKPKCPPREQSYKDNWLQMTEFKSWLSKRMAPDGKTKPFCKVCTCWLTQSSNWYVQTPTNDATTSIEVKLCAFFAEHNLSLSLSENMVTLIRSLCPNDAALSSVKLGKQKTTNIIRQVLGFDYLRKWCHYYDQENLAL